MRADPEVIWFESLTRPRHDAEEAEHYESAAALTSDLDAVAAELATARSSAAVTELTAHDSAAAVARATGIPLAREDAVGASL